MLIENHEDQTRSFLQRMADCVIYFIEVIYFIYAILTTAKGGIHLGINCAMQQNHCALHNSLNEIPEPFLHSGIKYFTFTSIMLTRGRTFQKHSTRPHQKNKKYGHMKKALLLLLPFAGLLWVPLYNHSNPVLFGFPFFYSYQFAWVPVTSVLIWAAWKTERQS